MKGMGIVQRLLITGLLVATGLVAEAGGALVVANSNFELGGGGDLAGWHVASTNFSIVRGMGVNGNGALVWHRPTPGGHDSAYQEVMGWKPGERYEIECKVRLENFTALNSWRGCIGLEMFDRAGKWLDAAYAKATRETGDFIKIQVVSREIPAATARVTLSLFVGAVRDTGLSGKAIWDDVVVRPFVEKPVAFVRSSRYRDLAVAGKVTFGAAIKVPRELAGKAHGVFIWRDSEGVEQRTPAARMDAREAVVELDVARFFRGTSTVRFELCAGEKTLGTAALDFTRAERLPERRIWIDDANRCIVDGKPFFPLGMYGVGVSKKELEAYRKGPFNCLLTNLPPRTNDLDRIHEMGLKALYSFQGVQLGTRNGIKYGFNTQAKVDEHYRRRAVAFRDHPGLLGWYLFDEPGEMLVPLLARSYQILRANDPNHPIYGVHHVPDEVQSRLVACDVIGVDPYPIAYGNYSIRWISESARKAVRAQFGRALMWNIPQNMNWEWYRKDLKGKTRFPTLDELKSMNWQHIAAGANGLIGYCYGEMCAYDANFAADWQAVCAAYEEVRRLMPVLLADPYGDIRASDEALGVRAWEKDGSVYVLACNLLEKPLKACVTFQKGRWRLTGTIHGAPATSVDSRAFAFDLPALDYSICIFLHDDE